MKPLTILALSLLLLVASVRAKPLQSDTGCRFGQHEGESGGDNEVLRCNPAVALSVNQ